jgi:hypothetical protein
MKGLGTRTALRTACVFLSAAAALATLQPVALSHDRDEPLVVTGWILVNSHHVSRLVVEDTYRAELRHTATRVSHDFADVAARIVHPFGHPSPGNLQIIDGDLEFGSVRAGQTVASRDTVTIRRHRHHPLKLQHLRWAISGRPDLILPEAWAGRWRLAITSRDADTGSIAGVDEMTTSLGVDEPVGFSLLPEIVRCTWTGTDRVLEANCRAQFSFSGCSAQGSARFTITRNDNALAGHGEWEVAAAGICGPDAGSGGASLEIAGTRLTAEAEPEPFSPGVLARLATTPALVSLIADRLVDGGGDPPNSDEDCKRGRWRRFRRPAFKNTRECVAFAEHHGERREGRR